MADEPFLLFPLRSRRPISPSCLWTPAEVVEAKEEGEEDVFHFEVNGMHGRRGRVSWGLGKDANSHS